MKSWLKKIFILSSIIFIVGIYATPVFAVEDPDDFRCWGKSLCEQKKGVWTQTVESKKICDPIYKYHSAKYGDAFKKLVGDSLAFCVPQQAEVKLQVPIGGLTKTSTLLNYIPNLYTYAVSIVSIIAVIMIMVGGLRYLTAGGAQDKVTSAKNTILGAVVGLFLVFGANLLLRTVNPDLTTLKLPQITMIRTIDLLEGANNCQGVTPSVDGLGKCTSTCECKGGATCLSFEESGFVTAIKAAADTGIAIATMGTGGSGTATVLRGSKDVLLSVSKKILTFANKHKVITTAIVGGSLVINGLSSSDKVENGICIPEAKGNLGPGELCAFDRNCANNKCVIFATGSGNFKNSGGMGACFTDPKIFEGTKQCKSNADCATGDGGAYEYTCVGDKTTGGICSNGGQDTRCCLDTKFKNEKGEEITISCAAQNNFNAINGERQCKSNLTCAFNYDNKLYPIGVDYTEVPYLQNANFFTALFNSYKNYSNICVSATDSRLQQPNQ